MKTAQDVVDRVLAELMSEFGTKEASISARLEEGLGVELVEEAKEISCLRHEGARQLLSLLTLLPHGVLKMSHDLEGLVSYSGVLIYSVVDFNEAVEL